MTFKKNPFHDRINVSQKELYRLENSIMVKDRNYTIRQSRERYYFPDEWKTFVDCLKKSQELTFRFLINTGGRINEIRNVQVNDADFERNSLVLRWTKTRNKDGSRKIRTIPISPQFSRYLKKMVNDYNLKNDDKFPILSTPGANLAMKKALRKAGIPDWQMFSVHNVRKTLEVWLLALDVDSLKIIKHFGHTMMMAAKHYVSPDIFNYEDKDGMRQIIGDLYRK